MKDFLDRWYKPLFLAFLVGIVILSYEIGHADEKNMSVHGVTLSCDKDTLSTLSMQSSLGSASLQPTTATTSSSASSTTTPAGHNFVASKNGTKYYPLGCNAANRINEENKVWFATEEEAVVQGYSRTTSC